MDVSNKGDFAARLAVVAAETQAVLELPLGDKPAAGEIARPPRLLAAMRHAVLGGGKRLRPFLLMETAALFDAARQETYQGALLAGAAPAPFGAKADILRAAARFVVERRT